MHKRRKGRVFNIKVYLNFFHRVGEGRACWSLGNAFVSLGNHKKALHYARKHLEISKEVRTWFHLCWILRPCAFEWISWLLHFIPRLETEMGSWRPEWMWSSWWRHWGSMKATFHLPVQSLKCKVNVFLVLCNSQSLGIHHSVVLYITNCTMNCFIIKISFQLLFQLAIVYPTSSYQATFFSAFTLT